MGGGGGEGFTELLRHSNLFVSLSVHSLFWRSFRIQIIINFLLPFSTL